MNVASVSSQLFYSADMGMGLSEYLLLAGDLLTLPLNKQDGRGFDWPPGFPQQDHLCRVL